jgi:hypothetical protein
LEQIVVRALHGKRKDDYAACVQSVLEFLGDNILNVRIVDPANSNNVIEVSDRSRRQIQSIAQKNLNARYWSDVIW